MKKSIHLTLLVLLFLAIAHQPVGAQPGALDTTFNSFDLGTGGGVEGLFDVHIKVTAVQTDGKIIIGGDFSKYNNQSLNDIIRLNADGTVDASFQSGSGVGANDSILSIAILSDGDIMIAGRLTLYNGTPIKNVARLNANGTLDVGFNVGTGPDGPVYAVEQGLNLGGSPKVIIGGNFNYVNGTNRSKVAVLRSSGAVDTTFNPPYINGSVRCLDYISTGKIYIGGTFTTVNGVGRGRVARLLQSGGLDGTFQSGSEANGPVYALARQSDGKILIGGSFTQYDGDSHKRIVRLNDYGGVDPNFYYQNGLNPGFNDDVYAIAVASDGKIAVGGDFTDYQGIQRLRFAVLNSTGNLSTPYKDPRLDGTVYTVQSLSLMGWPYSSFLVGGRFWQADGEKLQHIGAFWSDGSKNWFNPLSGAEGIVRCSALQPDGKILLGGDFQIVNETNRKRIVRLLRDGSVDVTFSAANKGANNNVHVVALDPTTGDILIGGDFDKYQNNTRNKIARLNHDGNLDGAFDPGLGPQNGGRPHAIHVLNNGKILVAGDFKYFNNVRAGGLARLLSNGAVDATFNSSYTKNNSEFDGDVFALAVQPDGKIIGAGKFTKYNGVSRNGIARLNADGSLDSSFNPGLGIMSTEFILSMALQTDGKIIIGGVFNSYNGVVRNGVARLNQDGSLDTLFDPGTGFSTFNGSYSHSPVSVALQNNGKVLVAGSFDSFDGQPIQDMVRLNDDGGIDTLFNTGVATNNHYYSSGPRGVLTILVQPDNKIVFGGNFYEFNGVKKNNFARLQGDGEIKISTEVPDSIDCTSARSGNNSLTGRNQPILAKGVCWNTMGAPTLNDDFTNDGPGLGLFNSTLTGLQPNTIYAVRAYATDIYGTVYGNEEIFKTAGVTLNTSVVTPPFCANGLATVKVGYSGGFGLKTILWSHGDTTKVTQVTAGVYTVTVTDDKCSITDTVVVTEPAHTDMAVSNVVVTKNGSQIFNLSWNAAPLIPGKTVIGYRVAYRLRGTTTFNQLPLTTNLTASVNFTGLGLCNGNYDFTVYTRFDDNGTPTTSAPACFVSKGYNGGSCKALEFVEDAGPVEFDFTVYPNPSNGIFYLEAPSETQYEVYELRGGKLLEGRVENGSHTLDLSAYAKGVYLLRLQSGERIETQRLMRE